MVVVAAILAIVFGRMYPERQSSIVLVGYQKNPKTWSDEANDMGKVLLVIASTQSSAQGLILHVNSWIHLRRQHKAEESTRTNNFFNTQVGQNPSRQGRDLTMGWDYSQSSNAYTPHTSRDGLALESEAPMGLTGLGGVRSLELQFARQLSPPKDFKVALVTAQPC